MSVQGRMSVCGCMKRLQPEGMIHSLSRRTMQFFINIFPLIALLKLTISVQGACALHHHPLPSVTAAQGSHRANIQGTDPEEIQLSRLRYFFPAISQL